MKVNYRKYVIIFLLFVLAINLITMYTYANTKENKEKGKIIITKLKKEENKIYDGTGEIYEELEHVPLSGIIYRLYKLEDEEINNFNEKDGYNIENKNPYKKGKTDEKGNLIFDDLPEGVYYLHEEDCDGVEEGNSFFVRIPTTSVSGDNLIYDVYVYPKNDIKDFNIDLEKKIIDSGNLHDSYYYDIDDIISWQIKTSKPKTIKLNIKNTEYTIKDEIDNGMLYKTDTLTVKIGKDKLNEQEDYNLLYTDKNILEIKFTEFGIEKIADSSSEHIYIEYKTIVDKEAISKENLCKKIENNVEVIYKLANITEKEKKLKEKPYIYSKGIKIIKKDLESNSKLEGAEFKLYKKKNNEEYEEIEAYFFNDNDKLEKSNTFKTNGNGEVLIWGLKDGDYMLEETKAPIVPGTNIRYNKLRDKIKFNITQEYDNNGCIREIEIKNSKGFKLPQTGGIGTRIFIGVGVLLLGTSIIINTNSEDDINDKYKEK